VAGRSKDCGRPAVPHRRRPAPAASARRRRPCRRGQVQRHGGLDLGVGLDRLAGRIHEPHARHPGRRTARSQGQRVSSSGVFERNDADRAARGELARLFARVVGALAVGELRRRAGQHHRDLARHVHAGEVVVVEFGRGDAEADEHERRGNRGLGAEEAEPGDEVHRRRELDALAAALDRGARRRHHARGLDQLDRLQPRTVGTRGLETERRHLRRDVARCDLEAARTGGPALEQVVGEELDVRADRVRGRRGRIGGRRRRQAGRPRIAPAAINH
jgi:hypothetical protein